MASSDASKLLSQGELQKLSHDELLAYAIRHVSAAPQPNSGERNTATANSEIRSEAKAPTLKRTASIHGSGPTPKKKRRNEFDMKLYGQRMIALKLNYHGWRFHGFASQSSIPDTVEGYLFTALLKTRMIESRDSCHYSRAGRTDVGVSAMGQVIGLQVRSAIVAPSKAACELNYVKAINSALPEGIRVMAWSPVCDGTANVPRTYSGDRAVLREHWETNGQAIRRSETDFEVMRRPGERFSARFDTSWRSYKYFFARCSLNVVAMSKAAAYFVGKHDFRNFCKIDEHVTNFERVMYSVEIRRASDDSRIGHETGDVPGVEERKAGDEFGMCYILVCGQAFLWHQVRCMAAVLLDIGRGHEQPKLVGDMLADAGRSRGAFAHGRPHYRLASATPLVLFECVYPRQTLWFGGVRDKQVRGGAGYVRGVHWSFVKADSEMAQSWACEAAKSAVLHAMLRGNETMLGAARAGGELGESNNDDRCGEDVVAGLRKVRKVVLGVSTSKHVPYRLRGRDECVSKKLERMKKK